MVDWCLAICSCLQDATNKAQDVDTTDIADIKKPNETTETMDEGAPEMQRGALEPPARALRLEHNRMTETTNNTPVAPI